MITPRIPLLSSGQILSVDVVNSIIKRTEYAGDLLKQYKLIAGTEMYVEPHYDGTRVSYLQPVGGGGTPQPVAPPYRIVGTTIIGGVTRGFLYNGSTFTDIFVPGSLQTVANGISGSNIVCVAVIPPFVKGFIYNGSTFTEIFVPGSLQTEAYGISGSNIVGLTYDSTSPIMGFLYNGSTFTTFSVPGSASTIAYGIG
jgi:hypothetical protein